MRASAIPGMTAASSSCAVKAGRSSCSFAPALGGAPFLSTFFFPVAWVCACADIHAAGGHAKSSMQISPAATPQPMRSVCKGFSNRSDGFVCSTFAPVLLASRAVLRIRNTSGRRRVKSIDGVIRASTPRRAPHAGAGPARALAAPAAAAGRARESPRANGVLRTAGHAHGDATGR